MNCNHCGHPSKEHTNSLRCRVCKRECGINCITPAYLERQRREEMGQGSLLDSEPLRLTDRVAVGEYL